MIDYDPNLAWSLVNNKGLMEWGSSTSARTPPSPRRLFEALGLRVPVELLSVPEEHAGYRIWSCYGPRLLDVTSVSVRCSPRVCRWSAFVVLAVESVRAQGLAAPPEYVAIATTLLMQGVVEVLR